MKSLRVENLPMHRRRRFVPERIDLGSWKEIEPFFEELERRAATCASVGDLERWLLDWGEVSAALDEESSARYLAMTCNTEDADAQKAYLNFVERVEPQLKISQSRLQQIYVRHPLRGQLPPQRYGYFDRLVNALRASSRPESVRLETEERRLGQQYQSLTGSLRLRFRGEEQSLGSMSRYLEHQDRKLRQEAWEMVASRRLQEAERFEDILDQLLAIRNEIAFESGFGSYLDFVFRTKERDYAIQHCLALHDAIAKEVTPLQREIQSERRRQLQVEVLRPWDLAVDPLKRPPLRPFETEEELFRGAKEVLGTLDPEFGAELQMLERLNLLDLRARRGKAPGAFTSILAERRLPFLFMNAVGRPRDVDTIFHLSGHLMAALALRDDDFFFFRWLSSEFASFTGMTLELLSHELLTSECSGVFYSRPEAMNARRRNLESIVDALLWIVTVDAFQHQLYSHPDFTRRERRGAWLQLMERFGGLVDWTGYEEMQAHLWHRQIHIFQYPLYFIEFAIGQVCALQVWARWKQDKVETLRRFRRSLALAGSRPLLETFEHAGCHFDFSSSTLRPLIGLLRIEIEKLR